MAVHGERSYDERFVHFVVLFNVDLDYFECHEVMEELWLEEGRNLLYQGLLQAAVGLHHWRNDNFSGAVKLFNQALQKLVHYPDAKMGLDLRQLRIDVARSLTLLGSGADPRPAFVPFEVVVEDDQLRLLAKALAEIPLELRLHEGD
ncbi:DUF309 domain-containing protein [Paenibacillus sp. OV219]|uniref:DUF309 domain-containing protein n=1 Tax=Paenibacillus sp. OV219 TaxID=1884377 RepID=UPI0008CE1956|nr:DUF309 domain-containing protein [Paenibacillus sp. OV219]SEM70763.1 hypothetical protein SAMN05518847_101574 [Paenibacillus sp. OV219]